MRQAMRMSETFLHSQDMSGGLGLAGRVSALVSRRRRP
jgi:hypothetical protein